MPGHLNDDEMREWMVELESGVNTPQPRAEDQIPNIDPSFDPFNTPSERHSAIVTSYPEPDVYPQQSTRLTHPPRSAVSLDLTRASRDLELTRGGRELADEADLYAISRGAKRPDYGKLRGESRTGLLGGGVENHSEAGDLLVPIRKEVVRDYGRSRGDSSAALLGRPRSDTASSSQSSYRSVC